MFLKQRSDGHLVKVLTVDELFSPSHREVRGRLHYGEEMQEAEGFEKSGLVFPSGEALPQCWVDTHYRDAELRH